MRLIYLLRRRVTLCAAEFVLLHLVEQLSVLNCLLLQLVRCRRWLGGRLSWCLSLLRRIAAVLIALLRSGIALRSPLPLSRITLWNTRITLWNTRVTLRSACISGRHAGIALRCALIDGLLV